MQSSRCIAPKRTPKQPSLLVHFATLPEPRRAAARITHPLLTIVGVVLVGMLCGAEGWDEIETIAEGKRDWLSRWLDLRAGVPSADTLQRVFRLLRPQAFGACLSSWMRSLVDDLKDRVVAIDGKTLRGVGTHSDRTLHLVHVWASEARVLLGMTGTTGAPGELEATRAMLEWLDVRGAILTTDANGCCRENMGLMVEKGAQWLCSLKGNRGAMHDRVAHFFQDIPVAANEPDGVPRSASAKQAHGRLEVRHIAVASAAAAGVTEEQLPGVRSVIRVTRVREVHGELTREDQFYVSSLEAPPERFGEIILAHWGVENGLHWVLDAQLREDDCSVSAVQGAENLAAMRRAALVLLRRDDSLKKGVKIKSKRAACDNAYLAHVLLGENA